MLHIISTGSAHDVLLERIDPDDALLFIADAVLCLQKNSQAAKVLAAFCQPAHCYVLEADLLARGLAAAEILVEIQLVDYQGFVALTEQYEVIKTWN